MIGRTGLILHGEEKFLLLASGEMSLKHIGQVAEIWRYPVRSIGGESIHSADIDEAGLVGDRQYVLIDLETRLPAAPEKDRKWYKALHLSAQTEPNDTPIIKFPNHHRFKLDDPKLNDVLSDYFGFETAIAAYDSGDHVDLHLMQHRLSHSPAHILTTSSLRHLANLRGVDRIDHRRFRPTVLIETMENDGFEEDRWIGHNIQVGPIVFAAVEQTKRCAITMLSQPSIEEDVELLRCIVRSNRRSFGIYCAVVNRGEISVGDKVALEDVKA